MGNMSDSQFMPPASFEFLVVSLRMQADAQLVGEDKDLPFARHAIDLLAVLSEKTKNNLTIEEQRLLENSLTELRFRYVQATGE